LVHQFDCPAYKGVLTDICSFSGPNFTIVIILVKVTWYW